MAQIFKASDLQQDGRLVAVKMFRPDVLANPLALEAFRRETEAIRSCLHPNIIELLDTGVDQQSGRHFLVLEWMAENLEDTLARGSTATGTTSLESWADRSWMDWPSPTVAKSFIGI